MFRYTSSRVRRIFSCSFQRGPRGPRVMAEEGSSETLPPASHSASLEGDSSRGASLPLPDCPLPCTEFAKRSSAQPICTGESQVRGLGPSSTPWQRVVRPPFAEDIPDTSTPLGTRRIFLRSRPCVGFEWRLVPLVRTKLAPPNDARARTSAKATAGDDQMRARTETSGLPRPLQIRSS